MKSLPLYQVDAFTSEVFKGNPAAVCLLDTPLEAELMQRIAAENNLSETAFVLSKGEDFELRWFTPTTEVALCGHATLASAFVLWEMAGYGEETLSFRTRESGELKVRKLSDGQMQMDFPADQLREIPVPKDAAAILGMAPVQAFVGRTDILLAYPQESDIRGLEPDFHGLGNWPYRGIIVTAPGDRTEFVSRFFGPRVGVDEDPVTGSAHTSLVPYWSALLGKETLSAIQASKRGGDLTGIHRGDRVLLNGKAVLYLSGSINV